MLKLRTNAMQLRVETTHQCNAKHCLSLMMKHHDQLPVLCMSTLDILIYGYHKTEVIKNESGGNRAMGTGKRKSIHKPSIETCNRRKFGKTYKHPNPQDFSFQNKHNWQSQDSVNLLKNHYFVDLSLEWAEAMKNYCKVLR